MATFDRSQIEIFSTTPQSKDFPRETYVQQVIDVARLERASRLHCDSRLHRQLHRRSVARRESSFCRTPRRFARSSQFSRFTCTRIRSRKWSPASAHLYGRRMYLEHGCRRIQERSHRPQRHDAARRSLHASDRIHDDHQVAVSPPPTRSASKASFTKLTSCA